MRCWFESSFALRIFERNMALAHMKYARAATQLIANEQQKSPAVARLAGLFYMY
jgi:hypothetical protein